MWYLWQGTLPITLGLQYPRQARLSTFHFNAAPPRICTVMPQQPNKYARTPRSLVLNAISPVIMPFVRREGRTRLYYEVHGSSNGKPLLLTHGYSSTHEMWKGQIEDFTQAGYRLIIWSMRGHGRSSYPEAAHLYSEKLTVEDIKAILDEVVGEGNQAIVGGLSLGGYVSQAFYRDYPERVKALLIIGRQNFHLVVAADGLISSPRYRTRLQKRFRQSGMESNRERNGRPLRPRRPGVAATVQSGARSCQPSQRRRVGYGCSWHARPTE